MRNIQVITGDINPDDFESYDFTTEDDRIFLEAFVATYVDLLKNPDDVAIVGLAISLGENMAGLSDEKLRTMAAGIVENATNDPKYGRLLVDAAKLDELSARWSGLANGSSSGHGYVASRQAADAYARSLNEARTMIASATNEADMLTGLARLSKASGALLGRLGWILPVAVGAYQGVADTAIKGLFGGLAGYLAGAGIVWAMGGAAAIAGLPLLAASGAVAIVIAGGFAVGTLAELVWDEVISDNFWNVMDAVGLKDPLDFAFGLMSEHLQAWFPTSDEPENDVARLEWVSGGVANAYDTETIVFGNSYANEINMTGGRTIAFGGGGDDVYNIAPGARGNQVITDADGNNKIYFGIENIANIEFVKISSGVYRSSGGTYTIVTVPGSEGTSLVISSTGYEAVVTVLNWSAGDFGIELPGTEPAPEPSVPLTTNGDVYGIHGVNDTSSNDVVTALDGNDGLSGQGGDDSLDGGAGDDLIFGGHGDDRLYGGDGNDEIIDGTERVQFSEQWDDETPVEEYGGRTLRQYHEDEISRLGSSIVMRGSTWYIYRNGNKLTFAGFVTDIDPSGRFETLDPNVYPGGDDVIDGGAGDDRIQAGEGDDVVIGGTGNDRLNGGHDHDVINGGDGDDTIFGDAPEGGIAGVNFTFLVSDEAEAGGNDVIDAGSGNDLVAGGGGDDVIYGGTGNDILNGRGQNFAIDESDQDVDYIDGGDGDDQIVGDDGNDTLLGGEGSDVVRGDQEGAQTRSGDDHIDGGAGDDFLYGDGGNDIVLGGSGADHIQGDSLDLSGDKHGNDTLSGGDGNDVIAGLGGNDVLRGDEGDDQLVGDAEEVDLPLTYHGNDQLFGGAGNDLLWGGSGDDMLDGGTGNDRLDGGLGDDLISGGEGDDELYGLAGNDTLSGGAGSDNLASGDGNDSLSGDAGVDVLDAGAGNDTLDGGSGNDTLDGDDGDDKLYGAQGDDVLQGGLGNDVLSGGTGNDTLMGAQGDDRYILDVGWGSDTINGMAELDAGRDAVVFGAGVLADELDVTISATGDVVLIAGAGSDQVTLRGFLSDTNAGHRIEFADGTVWHQNDVLERLAVTPGGLIGDESSNVLVAGQTAAPTIIYGGLGNDLIVGGSGADTIFGANGDSEIGTLTGPDQDVIHSGSGADTVYAESGDDFVEAGDGDDKVYGGDGDDRVLGGDGNDELEAGGSRNVSGIVFNETGDDFVVGGYGDDVLSASLGTNTYYFDSGFGRDTIYLTRASSYEVSQLGLSSERAIIRFGNGITAADVSLTRDGSDLVIQHGQDQIDIHGYGGDAGTSIEFVFEDGSTLTAQQLETLTRIVGTPLSEFISGTNSSDVLEGAAGDDSLVGGAGDDVLIGGAGRDMLNGGAGSDTYRYGLHDGVDTVYWGDANGHDVLELGAGILLNDTTFHRATFSDGNAELYMLIGSTGSYIKLNFTAGQTDQTVDEIRFLDGSSMTIAQAYALSTPMSLELSFTASPGMVTLIANAYANDIYGNSDWSTMLYGGLGDDTYYIDDRTTGRRGTPSEGSNEGNDTVIIASYNYTLPENIENLVTRYINFWTPGLPRQLTGNSLDNIIDTSAASSSFGWYGVNRIDGGLGADLLIGSGVDDIYVIDNIGDRLIEPDVGTSMDTVEASISYSIANMASLENITLIGTDDIYARGNDLANRLDGSTSSGSNRLIGGDGDDIYVISIGDIVVESHGGGTDTVEFRGALLNPTTFSLADNVENGVLGGYTNQIGLIGNNLANVLNGNSQNNVLDGGMGDDVLQGGGGSDIYYVDSTDDIVIEGLVVGYDRIISSALNYTMSANVEVIELAGNGFSATGREEGDLMLGSDIENLLLGMGGGDEIEGRGGNDHIDGGVGDDRLDGGGGDDIVLGGDGDDHLQGADGNDVLEGGFGADQLHGGDGMDVLRGGDEADLLHGEAGNDVLHGGLGDDRLYGGYGDDLMVAEEGNDYLDGAEGDDTLLGGAGSDEVHAGSGDDSLEGGAGIDQLYGGDGADAYVYNVGDGSDSIFDYGSDDPAMTRDVIRFGAGIDLSDVNVYTSARYGTTWIELFGESISIVGVEDFRLDNGTLLDILTMATEVNDAPEVSGYYRQPAFTGKPFNWVLPAEAFYDEDALAYSIVEMPSWLSYDPVLRRFSGSLPASPSANYLIVVRATDTHGLFADLSIEVPVLASIDGNSSANTLNGTSAPEGIFGYEGNDTLSGAGGDDYLYGGAGNDTYLIDGNGDDSVIELSGEGVDSVSSSVSYRLTVNVENMTLTGSSSISGEGNELGNVITGNGASNNIYGNDGNDTLSGNSGDDYLIGGDGDDLINGGSGSDEMYGGLGNDRYVVDANDYIEEYEDEGIDLVETAATYTLGENFENLTLTGTSGVSGNGNFLDNVITGNSGANTLRGYDGSDYLDGGSGNDTMIGGAGDDTYVVGVAGDVVTELPGEGVDTVISSVAYTLSTHLENLTLSGTSAINGTGNAGENILIGNSGANALSGLGGDDVLEGRGGTDTLTGGAGNDGYLMARGYGSDTVVENDATSGNLDVARFLSGVTYDQLWFRRPSSSNNLEITIIGTSDKLIIKDWYLGNQYRIEEIRTSDDGMLLTMTNVQALVSAMSGMTMPAQGQTTLTTAQRNQLAATFASTWQSQPSAQRIMTTLPASTADEDVPGAPVRFTSSGGYLSEALLESRSPSELCGGIVWAELDNIDLWPGRSDVQTKPLIVGRDPIVVGHDIPTKPLSLDAGEDLRLLIEAMAGFNGFGSECADVHHATAPLDVRIAIPLI